MIMLIYRLAIKGEEEIILKLIKKVLEEILVGALERVLTLCLLKKAITLSEQH